MQKQLVYDKKSVSNQELARLFLPICKELKIDVLDNLPSEIPEGDLETYIKPGGEYATARRMYSDIQMQWASEKREPLIYLTDEIHTLGCNILEKNGLPKDTWFVGLHIRSAKDLLRVGRNADFENYVDAVAEISQHGGWTLRTGTEQSKKLFSLPNFIDTRALNLSKFEREVLHTYGRVLDSLLETLVAVQIRLAPLVSQFYGQIYTQFQDFAHHLDRIC